MTPNDRTEGMLRRRRRACVSRHLNATIHTGLRCIYVPDSPAAGPWEIFAANRAALR